MNSVLRAVTRSSSFYKLSSPKQLILRGISITKKIKEKPSLLDKTNHKVIYDFKYIVFPAGFLKTKYWVPIACIPLLSVCFYLNEPKMGVLLMFACVLQCAVVFVVSRLIKNIIGKIYVNKEGEIDNVIISFIDSNGRRIDKSFIPDQLSLSEFGLSKHLGFVCVKTGYYDEIYKMNVRNANIYDSTALKTIFHNFSAFMDVKYIIKKK